MSVPAVPDPRRELGRALRRFAAGSGTVGVVRVLDRHGFGTVESGQLLAGTAAGATAGLLYRGALDDSAVPLARSAGAGARIVDAHVTEAGALAAGLACAGGATLLGHPLPASLAAALGEALEHARPAALVSTVDGGAVLLLSGADLETAHGSLGVLDAEAVDLARGLLRRGATVTGRHTIGDSPAAADVLVDLWVPVPSVLVVGRGAIGEALLAQAALLGWSGRAVTGPDEARAAVAELSEADVVVLLDHAPRFDAVLLDGLRGGRGFLGALGSRRTQAARQERLLRSGVTVEELARIHGPVGLDLGARTPAETAVSIVAEVLATRAGRVAVALGASGGKIGA